MNASKNTVEKKSNISNTFYGTHGNLNPITLPNISASQPQNRSIKSPNINNVAGNTSSNISHQRNFSYPTKRNNSSRKVGYPRRSTYNRFHKSNNELLYETKQQSFPKNVTIELNKQGYLNGISRDLCRNMQEFPLRVWVVDNSGSMNIKDGHKFELTKNVMNVTRCSRWEELQETVVYHAELASLLHAPTIFRLLNPSEGVDELKIATKERENGTLEFQHIKSTMNSLKPRGITPLTQHVHEIKAIIQSLAESKELQNENNTRIAIILATDGLPSNQDGVSSTKEKEEFIEALRSLEGLPAWIVVRLCTDDEEVVGFYNKLDAQLG